MTKQPLAFGLILVGFLGVVATAAPPVINGVSPQGITLGQANTLTIRGANLSDDPQLILAGVPVAGQSVKSAGGNQVVFELTPDASATPGIFALRVATKGGISAPLAIGVDSLPQQAFESEIKSLPVALSGALTGSTVLKNSFTAAKGQRVLVDVESRRLGAKLDPVVRVLDERGTQLTWSPGQKPIQGDARCELVIPSDGRYTVVLHDALYRGAAPGDFRLKIGDLQYVDFAMPLGVTRGKSAEVELLGAAGGTTANRSVEVSSDKAPRSQMAIELPANANITGAAPNLFVSPFAEFVEAPQQKDAPQPLAASPVAVSGRLSSKNERDQYVIPVKPGEKLRIDMLAGAVGSPIDGVLDVLRENGQRLAGNDDQPNTSDPGLDFDVPANTDKIVISVRDMLGRSGEDFVYRVIILPRTAPGFSLTLPSDSLQIPLGGQTVTNVKVARQNFAGPVKLRVHGLPEGVAVSGTEIPPGSDTALLTLTGSGSPASGVCYIEGIADGIDPPVRHTARTPATDLTSAMPLLADELGWAITRPGPIQLAWDGAVQSEAPLAGALAAQVRLTRSEGVTGEVRLSLLSNQIMPRKKIKKDNKEQEVDDLDRALRLEGSPVIAADQSAVSVNVLIPGDLPVRPWDVVVKGELLSADKKNVVAVAYTTLHRFTPVSPLRLELAGETSVKAVAGKGETGVLKGVVHRAEGFAQPVTVAFVGLPQGYSASSVAVGEGETAFELPVRFAYGTKPGELKDAKLVATAQSIRSNEVAVVVNVVPGEKPDAEEPFVIFEDDPKFLAVLNQGNGQISFDEADKHAGKGSAKVTPDQRYNPSVPSLGVKIREKPSAPDEYRYLTFAWKKQGGNSICLQINHDGAWGPGGNAREGAKFRYHAGPGGECYGASVVVDEKLPAEWTVVTRDLFADFGEFTFSGIAFSPVDGEASWFDAIYLGRSPADFELAKP